MSLLPSSFVKAAMWDIADANAAVRRLKAMSALGVRVETILYEDVRVVGNSDGSVNADSDRCVPRRFPHGHIFEMLVP